MSWTSRAHTLVFTYVKYFISTIVYGRHLVSPRVSICLARNRAPRTARAVTRSFHAFERCRHAIQPPRATCARLASSPPTARARRTCLTGSALRLRVDPPADRPSLAIRWGISTSLNSPGRRDAPQQLLSSLRRDSSSFAQCIQDLRLLLLTMATIARSCGATHSAGLHGSVVDADVEV